METEYEGYMSVLSREILLIEQIAALQARIRQAVLNREWADYEAYIDDMNRMSGEFDALDQERLAILPGDFYAIAARFPPEERKAITEVFRRLKLGAIKVRLGNDSLMAYLSEARLMVAGFLEAAFPDRKGKIYSPRGTQIHADMRSMVINQQL